MKKKPKNKKPFRITKPGLYRTRDGRMAFVARVYKPTDHTYPASGVIEGDLREHWRLDGGATDSNRPFPRDLISRWPGKKARRK